MSRRTEIQVGLTVLVAIAILILGIGWLKDWSVNRNTRTYHVIFPQAGGLAEHSEVEVNGIHKGEVREVHLVGDHVEMDVRLSKDVVLTTGSTVSIRNLGLMGERMVAVDLRQTGRPYAPGETVLGVYEPGPGEMMGALGGSFDAVNAISTQLKQLADSLSKNNRLSRSVMNFAETSEELHEAVSENRQALRATLGNFQDASRTAKHLTTDREAQLRQAMDHFSHAAENLDRMSGRLDSLRTVIQSLADKVQGGQGTVGKLVNDERLYKELNESVVSLRSLIEDVKLHPKKYLKFSVF